MTGSLHVHVVEGTMLQVDVTSDEGETLSLRGDVTDVSPAVVSDGVLAANRSLRSNMWSYAKTWYTVHSTTNDEALSIADPELQKKAFELADDTRKVAKKRSAEYKKVAQWIADVADSVSEDDIEHGWCSSCFTRGDHKRSNRPVGQVPVYICQECGAPTLECVAPGCENMAVRDRGAIRIPQFCAEHKHEISSFEKSQGKFGDLYDYEDYLKFDEPNLDVASKVALGAVAAVGIGAPVALIAAPAIGGALGALGVFGGLSGAAATSHGLALLGGGAIAAGGLGMAGGTAVVTAVGGALGGAIGASVTTAYLGEDKSFKINLLRPGNGGVPVVVANGFLSDGDSEKWGNWRKMVDERYPDSPVYRVHWGASELKDLGALTGGLMAKSLGTVAAKATAAAATKAGARFLGGIVGPAALAIDLIKNPWHVAKNRADKTGVILGDLLARTTADSYVLIGHSLGARVMAVAAETLGTKPDAPRIQAAHLLGTAIGAMSDWTPLTEAVEEAVYGYHSTNDAVLKYVYPAAQLGQQAAGLSGFRPATGKLKNIDVSDDVSTHFDYLDNVRLL